MERGKSRNIITQFPTFEARYNPMKLASAVNPDPMGWVKERKPPMDRFRFCSIHFPDGAELSFDIKKEDMYNTTMPIQLGIDTNSIRHKDRNIEIDIIRKARVCQKYLQFYGANVQFDVHNEYTFNRIHLHKEDQFGTWYDGYIYREDKLGSTECQICFDSNNLTTNEHIYDLGPFGSGRHFSSDSCARAEQILEYAFEITSVYPSWQKSFDDIIDDAYPILSQFFESQLEAIPTKKKSENPYFEGNAGVCKVNNKGERFLVPSQITVMPTGNGNFEVKYQSRSYEWVNAKRSEGVSFLGLLYLYLIKRGFSDMKLLKDIFQNCNGYVHLQKLIDIFDEIS